MLLSVGWLLLGSAAIAGVTTVNIHTDQVVHPVTRFLSGACIEDVNHEIYGGLYCQMIFGESFQEPAAAQASVVGFHTFGGDWVVQDQAVKVDGNDGPKLVSNHPPFTDGEVNVEMRFADRGGDNAGLLVRVSKPGVGADAFTGYEISVSPGRNIVRLARHRGNFELISEAGCDVPIGSWFPLQVKLHGAEIEILVNGNSILKHEDTVSPIHAGTVALRAWHIKADFRNLSVATTEQPDSLPFVQPPSVGQISNMWEPVVRGKAVADFTIDTNKPFVGSQSQQMIITSGDGEAGLANRGLNHWGMNLIAAKPYDGFVWVRSESAAELSAALETGDGSKTVAVQALSVVPGDWQRLDFSLTPSANDKAGRFVLKLKHTGAVTLGYAFLEPGPWGRFHDLPVRADVVQGLIDQGVSVLRYGGSMVNDSSYRWKNMLGPRDRRPPYKGTWYPYSSNGWGVIDFLNLCEAAHIVGIPDLCVDETPQDIADFIEYVNGPADSGWGKRRAADGHPEPYHLTHLELGNEERVDAAYARKFNALAAVLWEHDPAIIPVVGDFSYKQRITNPDHVTGADSHIINMDGQRQILNFAMDHNREVWLDIHIWSEHLQPSPDLKAATSYVDAIDQIAGDAKHRVVVFELNANTHGQTRALSNAISINTLKRDNRMPIVISANGLQPDGQNDNGWDQGLLFLNPSQVWLQPPAYITQMQARNDQPQLVKCEIAPSEASHLDFTATRSEDGKTVVLEVINTGEAESASITFAGFTPTGSTAHVTELVGPGNAANTADNPTAVVPKETEWDISKTIGHPTREFPAHSFTIIQFE
jgi:hypothetical protein